MPSYDYDLVVIGGGAAGLVSSKLANGLHKKVALIEKNKLGGECTWTGCVPSKTLIKSAEVAYHAKHLKKFGLSNKFDINLDTSHVMDHARSVVKEVYATHTPDELEKIGIDVIIGSPCFKDNHTIEVNGKTITARSYIIATGTHPFVPQIQGIDDVSYLTNQNLFDMQKLPASMIILGGGAIGCEMASALNRLGVEITIVEMQDRILQKEDEQLVALLSDLFKQEGITIATGHKATHVKQDDAGITLTTIDHEKKQSAFKAEALLVAVGRRPNIFGLGLEKAGVKIKDGQLKIDKTLRTTAKNMYACGDIVGPYLFSHMAYYQAAIATQNALLPWYKKVHYNHVAWVTFTAPELAHAGMTEKQAREKYGDNISVYTVPYDKLDRSHNDRNLTGLGKFICDKKGYLLGAHILGPSAGELIHEIQLAKTYGLRLEDIYKVIHAYPTYSELIWHAARLAYLERIRNSIFVRLGQKIMKFFKK